ncbi:phosphodiesterase [Paludibacterium yongneupense]|uniref:phosphodiesterase n=1 Tax=Paludibacterium yongneupense TaxID=400061 RepID=UPI00040A7141|nr:phosphodiesterase [Paludibacterium yongneupense]
MLIAQISDLHIKPPGRLAYGRVDTATALARTVAALNALRPRPEWVVISGDLTDSGSVAEYTLLKSLLEPLAMPYRLAVGNHDCRDALRAVFPDVQDSGDGDFIQYRETLGALELIVLDSAAPPASGGHLCTARLAWLERALAATAGRPTLIAMHHPPFDTGIAHMDAIGLDPASAAALATLVAAHPNVERLLCGHLHRPIQARFAGTLAQTCPSSAHQVALDLSPDGPSAFVLEPASFLIHNWRPGQGLVSHQVMVDDFAGPYPFFDPSGRLIP